MRKEEQWVPWKPIDTISGSFHEELICDDNDGLKIILYQQKNDIAKKLRITWSRSVISHTVTNETYVDQVFNDIRARDATYEGGTFFKIENSDLIKRLEYSSGGLSNYVSLTHFVILSSDSLIDVIADYEPKVEYYEENPTLL